MISVPCAESRGGEQVDHRLLDHRFGIIHQRGEVYGSGLSDSLIEDGEVLGVAEYPVALLAGEFGGDS